MRTTIFAELAQVYTIKPHQVIELESCSIPLKM